MDCLMAVGQTFHKSLENSFLFPYRKGISIPLRLMTNVLCVGNEFPDYSNAKKTKVFRKLRNTFE